MVVSERIEDRTGAAVRSLRWPAVAFLAGVLVHGSDHVARGMTASPPSIMVAGMVQSVAVVVTALAVWWGVRWAPACAVVVSVASVVGFTYAHLMPSWWPAYSDSFVTGPRIGVSWYSWVTVVAEMGTALVLGVMALRVRGTARA